MLEIEKYITQKQEASRKHLFFQQLQQQDDFFEGMKFAEHLTFWVMAFQDILRLIPPRIESKALRRIATHHKMEDGGHNLWFLQDLSFINNNQHKDYNIAWLFSKENEVIRDFSYEMISEVFSLQQDHQKVTLILTLESGGHVFFDEVSRFVKSTGYDSSLKYFSSYHLEVEQNHAVFEDELMKELLKIELSEDERQQSFALVDRFYNGVDKMHNRLLSSLNRSNNLTSNKV